MSPIRRIAILLHERDRLASRVPYRIWALREVWRRQGIEVQTLRGTGRPLDADVVIPHLDVSRVPASYEAYWTDHPRVVNRHCPDISKTVVSENLVRPGDDYQGPVIVKTDRNYGGIPEQLTGGRMAFGKAALRWLTGTLPRRPRCLARVTVLDPYHYPIFDSVADVPAEVFDNAALVVERFMPERSGAHYSVRSYSFFGDRGRAIKLTGPRPIVKGRGIVGRTEVPVPTAIIDVRRRLRLDYGKIDFVLHDGRPIAIDASRTPTTRRRLDEARRRMMEDLAEGVRCL